MTNGLASVATFSGVIRGLDGGVRRWLGIPYAADASGAWRWMAPQSVQPWTGARDAIDFGDDPPQLPSPFSRAAAQSENCLSLNVWSPSGASRLPVMVWFPGGGFIGGSGSDRRTDGARLAAEGAVVVAINYRIGLAGFMAHPQLSGESAAATSGNYGLLDQIQALRWVRDNIERFGGDARNVTAFGCSAGSASLSLLLTLPQAEGLIHKAILQSPGAFRPLADLRVAEQAGAALGPHVADLRALSWRQLLERTPTAAGSGRSLTGPRVLRPIRDGALVTMDESRAASLGSFANIPLMVGSNADEGKFFLARMPVAGRAGLEAKIREDFGAHADEALTHYGATRETDVSSRLAEVFGDTQFTWAADRLANVWAQRAEAPVWRYVFAHRSASALTDPTHTSELPYVFGTGRDLAGKSAVHGDEESERLSAVMRAAWVRFAATGSPESTELKWPAFTTEARHHLAWTSQLDIAQAWRAPQMRFLDRFVSTVSSTEPS